MAASRTREVTVADVERARLAGRDLVRHTPVLSSTTLSEEYGGDVVLKAESLQRTGAFKLRGALAKLAALGDACGAGVAAGSAGNHAQALAYAARARGVPCEVYMPTDASIAKAEGAAALGATVRLVGSSVEECMEAARERAREAGLAFVHPFDDPDVIAGQGTIGLELLEDVPDLAKVLVPLGGGGLASGTAIAVKSARPEVEVVGVQVEAFAPFPESLRRGEPVTVESALTIADGIAVKRPGELTLALIAEWVDDVVTVGEDDVAEAMVLLLEKAKLVVEGAGAVGVAALMAGRVTPASTGATVLILSGGNVDAGLLAMVARRHETEAGRRLVLLTRLPDRPGSMARLLACVGDTGANLLDVQHVREALDLHVRETAVQLVLETRGPEHAAQVLKAVADAGYETRVLQ
ncbi:MAG: threonine dehydratase [Solirubrobacteraceae bacterium]|jgi:threonine dehydratase|nr:threonine dehydratase [Solirubrobacteraceae bacterium]